MKKINKFYLLSLVLVSSTFVCAQQATTPLERKIIEKALDNFEMYKSCITIADEETRSYFLDLFKDKSVPVYNDLLGITSKKDINIQDYINEQKSNIVSPIINISNVNREKIWEEDGKWKVQFSFDKSLSYQNQCGINFNTQDFYGKKFRETMILVYDTSTQECRIESINGRIDSDRRLPEDYCILVSTNEKDNRIIYKHSDGIRERVKFNSFGQMLLTSGCDTKQFEYPDNDVIVKTDYKQECHLMTISYKSYHWRLKAHYDLGLGKALSVANESLYSSVGSKSSSFGIDAGYIFPSKGKFKIGVFLGFGIASTSLDLSYMNDLYSFVTSQDVDGDRYTRYYKDLRLNQTTKLKELSIPIYADLEWRFSRWVSAYLDLGLQLNMNLSNSVGEFTGSASDVYGIYSESDYNYGNIRLDYNWGYNGFTQNLVLTQDNLLETGRVTVKKFAPNLLIGFGFRVNIPRMPLALDLGLGYQKGMGDVISVSGNSNAGQYYGEMIYNQLDNNGKSTEHAHNLVDNAGNVSRNLLKFNIGLIYKF